MEIILSVWVLAAALRLAITAFLNLTRREVGSPPVDFFINLKVHSFGQDIQVLVLRMEVFLMPSIKILLKDWIRFKDLNLHENEDYGVY